MPRTKQKQSWALEIGRRIKVFRLDKKITQKEFAKQLGKSEAVIKAIEAGYNYPTLDMLQRLKNEYNLSYGYILDGISEQEGKTTDVILHNKISNLKQIADEIIAYIKSPPIKYRTYKNKGRISR